MKRIVIDARELRTSTGRYVERLLMYLQEVDTDLSHRYYVLLKPEDMEGWKPVSKRFVPVSCRYKEFTFAEQLGLLWQLYRLRPHLVHFAMVQQPILYTGKVVTTMHDLTTLRFSNPTKNRLVFMFRQRVYKWVNRIAARKSVAVITPSEYVKDDVARAMHINSRKITVTYEAGESIAEPAREVEGLADKRFIMYVGRPFPHKNLERLLEAFASAKQQEPDLHLVLAGKEDAHFRRLQRAAEKQGIVDVHFTGFISDGELRWLYERCLAYVFPSLSEGFGLPGLEAMHHGAPVISSDATCLPEIYGEAALYFDPLSTDDMAAKILQVVRKPALIKELSKKGRKQAAKYSWRRMAEQTLAIYKQALHED